MIETLPNEDSGSRQDILNEIALKYSELVLVKAQKTSQPGELTLAQMDLDAALAKLEEFDRIEVSPEKNSMPDVATPKIEVVSVSPVQERQAKPVVEDAYSDLVITQTITGSSGAKSIEDSPLYGRAAKAASMIGPRVITELNSLSNDAIPMRTTSSEAPNYMSFVGAVLNGSAPIESIPKPADRESAKQLKKALAEIASSTLEKNKTGQWLDLFFDIQIQNLS